VTTSDVELEHRGLAGVTPILVTPYDADGRIIWTDIDAQVEHLTSLPIAAAGIGFGSDILKLTERERDELVGHIARRASGRLKVVASTGANSIAAASERAIAAVDAGADILMVLPPTSITMADPLDLLDYFGAIARRVSAPIIVQDAPGMTGTSMSPELLAQLAREIPGVVAVKIEAVPSARKIASLASLDHGSAAILGGAGGMDFYQELRRGADGTIPGIAFTELFVEVHRKFSFDPFAARELFGRFLPLIALSNRDGSTFFRCQLEILRRRGLIGPTHLRSPAHEDPGLLNDLDELLEGLPTAIGPWVFEAVD
jgi:dihydrodipicolinate synthase/N-acetylneuraminate lyase